MIRRGPRGFALLVLCAFLTVTSGCGPGKGSVSGKVTYKEKSLTTGSVQFMTQAGVLVSQIGPDGAYQLNDVPTGVARISVTSQDPGYAEFMKQLSRSARDKSIPRPKGKPEDFANIPSRYSDFSTSSLSLDVRAGPQVFDLDLN
jgi:hypothetical protein